jgi:peptidoglycan/LPS O-acetylase OafA/YrhL
VFSTLDALRGFGALCVLSRHVPDQTLDRLFPGIYLAVDLFFVLSGFVLAHAYQDRLAAMGWVEFLRRRVVRLWPLYALSIVATVILYLVMNAVGGSHIETGQLAWWSALSLLFIPQMQNTLVYPLNSVAWSLLWELVINVVFAVVAVRLTGRVLGAIIAAGGVLLAATAFGYGALDVGGLVKDWPGGGGRVVFSFFAGVALYRLWLSGRLRWLRLPGWAAMAMLLALFAYRGADRAAFDALVVLIVIPVLVLACADEPAPLLRPVYAWLGLISYSVYILHAPVIRWIMAILPKITGRDVASFGVAGTAGLMVATVLVAWIATAFFEAPTRAALDRWTRPRRRALAAA